MDFLHDLAIRQRHRSAGSKLCFKPTKYCQLMCLSVQYRIRAHSGRIRKSYNNFRETQVIFGTRFWGLGMLKPPRLVLGMPND
jgi:hypothetical protein